MGCQFDSMVWDDLVNVAVLVSFGLGMPDQNNHLCIISNALEQAVRRSTYPWFAHDVKG
jgi:hypothetical protein